MFEIIGAEVREEKDKQHNNYETQREIDEKYPMPGKAISDITSQRWPDYRGNTEDGAHEALVFPPHSGGKKVADNGEGISHDNARADSLEAAEDDNLAHGLADAA